MGNMKPILFNTEMVRAILEDQKTVTRRVVKPQPQGVMYPMPKVDEWPNYYGCTENDELFMPPFHPGDILYVRETWAAWSRTMGTSPALYYKADGNASDGIKWRPSIHMPREAARIFLRVTDVRVERLQDITEEQVKAEGVDCYYPLTSRLEFYGLWDRTIKPADRTLYGWAANPWVWVIAFKRIRKEEISDV